MEQTTITREALSKRWDCCQAAVVAREEEGLIKRLRGLPGVQYRMKEVYELEGLNKEDIHQISPFQYRKLEAQYKAALDRIEQLEGKLYKLAAMACEEVAAEVRREKA